MWLFYVVLLLAYYMPGIWLGTTARIWASDLPIILVLGWRLLVKPDVPLEFQRYMRRFLVWPYAVFLGWLTIITVCTIPASDVPTLPILASLLGRYRPFLFLVFAIPYLYNENQLRKAFNFLVLIYVLQVATALMQTYNLLSINTWYTPQFRPEGEDASYMYLLGRRTIGTIGNPNSLGTFLSIFGVLGFAMFMFGRGRGRWAGGLVTLSAFVSCVFFAKTRQGALSIIIGCSFLTVVAFLLGHIGRVGFVSFATLLIAPIVLAVLAQDAELARRFAILRGEESLGNVGSIRARLELWPSFFDEYGAVILIGAGMGGFITAKIWDNGWLMMIVSGGVVLPMVYLWWTFRISVKSMQVLAYRHLLPHLVALFVLPAGLTLIVWLTNIVNNTFNDTKVATTIMLAYALCISAAYLAESRAEEALVGISQDSFTVNAGF